MNLRTIMIFPKFKNIEIIDNIRKKYDPLAEVVKPHITIVYPFESSISNEGLANIMDKRLKNLKSFSIQLAGVSRKEDVFGNYLFLNVVKGAEELCFIHKILYEHEF